MLGTGDVIHCIVSEDLVSPAMRDGDFVGHGVGFLKKRAEAFGQAVPDLLEVGGVAWGAGLTLVQDAAEER